MGILRATAVLLVGAGQIAQAQNAPSTSPDQPAYSLTIRTKQSEVKAGKPINVDVTLTNITPDKTLSIPIDRGENIGLTYDFRVDDSQGAEAPSTPYLRALKNNRKPDDPDVQIIFDVRVWTVPPGKSMTNRMDITRLFEIDVPGTYTVWVERVDMLSGI